MSSLWVGSGQLSDQPAGQPSGAAPPAPGTPPDVRVTERPSAGVVARARHRTGRQCGSRSPESSYYCVRREVSATDKCSGLFLTLHLPNPELILMLRRLIFKTEYTVFYNISYKLNDITSRVFSSATTG